MRKYLSEVIFLGSFEKSQLCHPLIINTLVLIFIGGVVNTFSKCFLTAAIGNLELCLRQDAVTAVLFGV